jgi:hypothetical protein
MPDLVVIVPSRGRPEAVAELAHECWHTTTAETTLLVVVDEDDPTLPQYRDLIPPDVPYVCGPPSAGHVAAINYGAARAIADFHPFALGKFDDDHRPRTPGWDARYIEALNQLGTGIAYGNDLFQGRKLPTAPAMTADIVKTLGFMGPPDLRHLFIDDFWRDLGEAAGCLRYLPNVVVEHMHPMAGKSEWTEGHQRVNEPEAYRRDYAAYQHYLADGFAGDVEKVLALRTQSAGQ